MCKDKFLQIQSSWGKQPSFALFVCFNESGNKDFLLPSLSPLSVFCNMRTLCLTFLAIILFFSIESAPSGMFLHLYPFSSHDSSFIEHSGSVTQARQSQHACRGCNLGICFMSYALRSLLIAFVPADTMHLKPAAVNRQISVPSCAQIFCYKHLSQYAR